MIPARARGRIDLIINGSFWLGAVGGGLLSLIFLDQSIFALDVGWRLAFGMGALLGIGILFVRRHLPESPRWLFIHGREEEAERLVDEIESEVEAETGQELEEPEGDSIKVRQRKSIPFREIARTAFKVYPKRAVLGLLAVHRPGLPLQRGHRHARPDADHLPRRRREQGRALLRRLRGRQLPRPAAARPSLRHRRPPADDRRHLPDLGGAAGRRRPSSSTARCSATGA